MKPLLLGFIWTGIILLLSSCEKAPFILMISPTNYMFGDVGGTQTVSFTCNRDWSISTSDSWIHITPSSGVSSKEGVIVLLTCDSNSTYASRSTTLTIAAEGVSEVILIEQKQNDAIQLKESEKTIPYEGGSVQIDLETNVDIDVSCPFEWVKQQQTKALNSLSLLFSVEENSTFEERTATIYVKQVGGTKQECYKIIQEARPPVNLSIDGTSNSYIVPLTDEKYAFYATVKGNSTEQIDGGEKVRIVWERESSLSRSDISLIKSLEYNKEDGVICFTLSGILGNALVALTDINGTILWSWHLWVTDYNPTIDSIEFANGAVLQDRNLGANSPTEIGFLYQWGRKDPLLSNAKNTTVSEGTDMVKYAIEHPDTFIMDNSDSFNPGAQWDWNCDHTSIWSTKKTQTDPCPPGWRVHDSNFLSGWPSDYTALYVDYYITMSSPICSPDSTFPCYGVITNSGRFYPEVGWIWTNTGHRFYKTYTACSVELGKRNFTYSDYLNYKNMLNQGDLGRTYGLGVRCQKE